MSNMEDGLGTLFTDPDPDALRAHPGPLPVYLELQSPTGDKTLIRAGEHFRVTIDSRLQRDLGDLLGAGDRVLTTNGHGIMVGL